MWTAIQDAFTNFITMVGELVTALTGQAGALAPLLPLFAIGIAISIFMVGFKAIKYTLPCYWWPLNALNSVNVYGLPSIYDNTERSPFWERVTTILYGVGAYAPKRCGLFEL